MCTNKSIGRLLLFKILAQKLIFIDQIKFSRYKNWLGWAKAIKERKIYSILYIAIHVFKIFLWFLSYPFLYPYIWLMMYMIRWMHFNCLDKYIIHSFWWPKLFFIVENNKSLKIHSYISIYNQLWNVFKNQMLSPFLKLINEKSSQS